MLQALDPERKTCLEAGPRTYRRAPCLYMRVLLCTMNLKLRLSTAQSGVIKEVQNAPEATPRHAGRRKRRKIRHSCAVALVGFSKHPADQASLDQDELDIRVLDLTPGGASLLARHHFHVGQELGLVLGLGNGATISTEALVRWTKPVPEREAFAVGVHFVHMSRDDSERIGRFLSELDDGPGQ